MICRKLNLKDTKYHNRVKLWVKHDEKYITLLLFYEGIFDLH